MIRRALLALLLLIAIKSHAQSDCTKVDTVPRALLSLKGSNIPYFEAVSQATDSNGTYVLGSVGGYEGTLVALDKLMGRPRWAVRLGEGGAPTFFQKVALEGATCMWAVLALKQYTTVPVFLGWPNTGWTAPRYGQGNTVSAGLAFPFSQTWLPLACGWLKTRYWPALR